MNISVPISRHECMNDRLAPEFGLTSPISSPSLVIVAKYIYIHFLQQFKLVPDTAKYALRDAFKEDKLQNVSWTSRSGRPSQ